MIKLGFFFVGASWKMKSTKFAEMRSDDAFETQIGRSGAPGISIIPPTSGYPG